MAGVPIVATKKIELAKLRIDGGTQPRASIDEGVVAEYAEAYSEGADMPPMVVFHDGAEYWLGDGFHRYHALRKLTFVEATVDVRAGTLRDAILYAVGANTSHGLRRSNEDKRKAVMTLLEDDEWSAWSDSEIARRCGVSHVTVIKYRAILVNFTSMDSPATTARTFTHHKTGKQAVMRTANIGRAAPKDEPESEPETEEEEEVVQATSSKRKKRLGIPPGLAYYVDRLRFEVMTAQQRKWAGLDRALVRELIQDLIALVDEEV